MAFPVGLGVTTVRKHVDRAYQLDRIRDGRYDAPAYPPLDPEIVEIHERLAAERKAEKAADDAEMRRGMYTLLTLIALTIGGFALLLYNMSARS